MITDIETSAPAAGQLYIWALGQSGFVFKNSAGRVLAIDPCLADPVAKVMPGWTRLYPPPVPPPDLKADILLITHNHLDHLDPDTISQLGPGAIGRFVRPGNAYKELRGLGIPDDRITRLDASEEIELEGIRITGCLALTNDAAQPDAEGFIIDFPDAPSVYHTGDTAFHALLANAVRHKPDIYMPCINGKFGNMDALEAAVLAPAIRPRWAIPHHFDMFRDNLVDPEGFRQQLALLAPDVECISLQPGERIILQGADR